MGLLLDDLEGAPQRQFLVRLCNESRRSQLRAGPSLSGTRTTPPCYTPSGLRASQPAGDWHHQPIMGTDP
jgi:hypothetical protein